MMPDDAGALYRRMRLIPSWDYARCAAPSVAVVGLGGLGAMSLQLLVLLGLGEQGETVLIDPDTIEPSNRTRIPYATPGDDGALKVEVAERWVRAVRPARWVRTVPLPVHALDAQEAIAACDVLVGAVDSELARLVMNHLAHAFCLPYIDGGAGFLVTEVDGERLVHGGGQVRLVVPGATPCLLCNLGLDRDALDREVMALALEGNAGEHAVLEASGYIRGLASGAEQPSAAHVNALVGGALVTMLLEYLLVGLSDHHALHLDLEAMAWMRSTAVARPHCAACQADDGGHGRWWSVDDVVVPLALGPEAASD